MAWIWEHSDWPNFEYDATRLYSAEEAFLLKAGALTGAFQHIEEENRYELIIDLLCDESLKTSEIEGEILNRESLRSSIRQHLGLGKERQSIPHREAGISELMVDVYQHFSQPLSHEKLFEWNYLLTRNHNNLITAGCYRTHAEPMQIVSGYYHKPYIHYEAPPSTFVSAEMDQFIAWTLCMNRPNQFPLPALTRAAITHLYFVCIHPFEDGNGRIARALALKSLSQSIDCPVLILLSETINQNKKAYYDALGKTNHSLNITEWLLYFSDTILKAQDYTMKVIEFVIKKSFFYKHFQEQLNPRQEKIISRLFREGVKGFEGGLSAKNYMAIANTTPSTATRDLQELVAIGALTKQGVLKGTRYFLNLSAP